MPLNLRTTILEPILALLKTFHDGGALIQVKCHGFKQFLFVLDTSMSERVEQIQELSLNFIIHQGHEGSTANIYLYFVNLDLRWGQVCTCYIYRWQCCIKKTCITTEEVRWARSQSTKYAKRWRKREQERELTVDVQFGNNSSRDSHHPWNRNWNPKNTDPSNRTNPTRQKLPLLGYHGSVLKLRCCSDRWIVGAPIHLISHLMEV